MLISLLPEVLQQTDWRNHLKPVNHLGLFYFSFLYVNVIYIQV